MTDKEKKLSRMWLAIAITVSVLVVSAAGSAVWYFFIGRTVWSDVHGLARTDDRGQLRQVLWTDVESLGEPINSPNQEYEPWVSPDGMELFFVRGKPRDQADPETGGANIYVSRRVRHGWSEPEPLVEVNSTFDELSPRITGDGQFLLFASNRPGGFGGFDIWASRRSEDGTWEPPFNLGEQVNTEWNEYSPAPTPDGRRLFFSSNRNVAAPEEEPWDATSRRKITTRDDLFVAEADPESASAMSFNLARSLDELNTRYHESNCVVSPAGDFLYFASNRPGGQGGLDIYRSRLHPDGSVGEPRNLGPGVNTPDNETDPMLLAGGFELYFSSDRGDRPGRYDLYRAESREVFRRRIGADAPTIGWQWWILLIALAALVPLLLFLKATDYRHLSLIQKCVLVSTLAHVLLCLLLGIWGVSRDIIEYVGEQAGMELAVNLDVAREVRMRQAVRDQSVELPVDEPAMEQVARLEEVYTPRERAQLERIELPSARHDPAMMQVELPRPRRRPAEAELARLTPELIEQPEVEVRLSRRQRLDESEPEVRRPEDTPVEVSRRQVSATSERRRLEAPDTASDFRAVATDVPAQTARPSRPRTVQRVAPDAPAPETPLEVAVDVPRTGARPALRDETSEPGVEDAPPLVERREPGPAQHRPIRVDPGPPERAQAAASTLQTAATQTRRAEVSPADRPGSMPDPVATMALDISPVGRHRPGPASDEAEPTIRTEAAPPMASAPQADVEVSATRASADVALPERTIAAVASGEAAPRQRRRAETVRPRAEPEVALDTAVPDVDVRPMTRRQPSGAREQAVQDSHEPVFAELASAASAVEAEPPPYIAAAPLPERTIQVVPVGPSAPRTRDRSPDRPQPAERHVAFDSEIDVVPMRRYEPSELSDSPERVVPDTVEPGFAEVASVTPPVETPASPTTTGSVHLPALPGPSAAPESAPSVAPSARPARQVEPMSHVPDVPVPEILPPGSLASLEALAHRSFEQRQRLIEQMGGSVESEAAVARALSFLARNQEPDGRWTHFRWGDRGGPGQRGGHKHDAALTGLAALAFLGADHTPGKPGPYSENIAAAMDYLVSIQKDDGDLRDGGDLYDQGIATLALGEAAAMTGDPRYRQAALAGAEFIIQAQGGDGGWRYRPGQDGDTSVIGWQAMALYSVERLGFHVPAETVERAREYFKKVSIGDYGMISGYLRGQRHDAVMTSEGAFSRVLLLKEEFCDGQRNEVIDKVMNNLPESGNRDFYYWYYGSLMMMQFQCENWEKWNLNVRELLIDLQQVGGDFDGAWRCNSRWGNRGGVIYTTALAAATLEVYYRYLPMLGGEIAPGVD